MDRSHHTLGDLVWLVDGILQGGGGVNMKRMGGMCGRLGERWRWVRPADIMARESSVERHDVGILVR